MEDFITFILIPLFILIVVGCFIINYVCICICKSGQRIASNKIKFKSFLAFYAINPKSWELKDNYVTYKKEQILEYDIGDSIPYYHKVKEEYDFSFSFIDFFQYYLWSAQKQHEEDKVKRIEEKKKKVKRRKEQEVKNFKDYQKFCEYIKQDLEQFKQSKPWEDIKL